MKIKNRKRLLCTKHIRDNIHDRFSVVVSEHSVSDAKKEFERQGYKVTEL